MRKYIDKKLFYILFGYALTYLLYSSLKGAFLKLYGVKAYQAISWQVVLFDNIIANVFVMPPTIVLIIFITKYLLDRNYHWRFVLSIHFILSFLYIIVIYAFFYSFQLVTHKRSIESISTEGFFLDVISNSNLHFLGYVGFVAIIYSYYYLKKSVKIELQKTQLSQQLTNVKLEMLKAQLNPHFLFNTLHSISSLIKLDPRKAQNMISSLGDLLREIIFIKHEDRLPLEKELDILNKYNDIMLIRFSDHLTIKIDIDEEVEKALVPSLITQPIVENSIKHGYNENHTHLEINITAYQKKNKLIIKIENNGAPLKNNKTIHYGTGLTNSIERMKTLYETQFKFSISSLKQKEGVVTIIELPFEIYVGKPNRLPIPTVKSQFP